MGPNQTVTPGPLRVDIAIVALLTPYAGQLVGVGSYWVRSVDHCLGLLHASLGDFDEADGSFVAAAAVEERVGAPAWLARTRLAWARTLLERNGPGYADRAAGLLDQALITARQLGMPHLERQAVHLHPTRASLARTAE